MATLRLRGKYYHIIDYDPAVGKPREFSLKETNKKIAQEILKDYNAQKRLSMLPVKLIPQKEQLKLSQVPGKYFEHKFFNERRQLADATKDIYKFAVKAFTDVCGDGYVNQYTKHDFKLFLDRLESTGYSNNKKYSVNTIANYTRHLNILFNWLVKQKYIETNVIFRTAAHIEEPEPIPLDHLKNILLKIIERKQLNNYLLVKLAYLCAMRKSEIVTAHGSDFDMEKKEIHIRNTKGKRIDTIPMLLDIEEFLKDYDLPDKPLFHFKHPKGIDKFWRNTNAALDYKYTFHQLRKTRGSELANNGIDLLHLKEFMRHRDGRTTEKYYIKINRDKMRDTINRKLHEERQRASVKSRRKTANILP